MRSAPVEMLLNMILIHSSSTFLINDSMHFLFLAAETYQKDLLLKGDWDHPVVTG